MEGYVAERSVKETVEEMEYEITTYQGEHRDEYLVKEVKSGRCELFYKGLLQLSWKEMDGRKVGLFTVYEKGNVLRCVDWRKLNENEYRYVENCKNGLELVVESGQVVYRGGFDDAESMKREGKGMEFDVKTGRVLRCGVWKNDELFQITQEFESDEVMIEYAIEEGKSNLHVLNRHPVYRGGYIFDDSLSSYLRNGEGYNIEGGIAVSEGKWERGELKDIVDMFNGWYAKMEKSDVFDWGFYKRAEVRSLNEWKRVDKRITKLVIPSNSCNESKWKVFDVSELKCLKSIEIGDDCFENVEEVNVSELKKLDKLVIGKRSFRKSSGGGNEANRHFYLQDCERLRVLKIGTRSFSDYSVCKIENLPCLESIEMDDLNELSCNFYSASLKLKRE